MLTSDKANESPAEFQKRYNVVGRCRNNACGGAHPLWRERGQLLCQCWEPEVAAPKRKLTHEERMEMAEDHGWWV
jgi:hypothetical protein